MEKIIDGLGRVQIPKSIREEAGIKLNDMLSIKVNDKKEIVLYKEEVLSDVESILKNFPSQAIREAYNLVFAEPEEVQTPIEDIEE